MKANELRIGNLVRVNGLKKYKIVSEIAEKYLELEESLVPLKYFEVSPILLTEELFIKFGFQHKSNRFEDYFVNPNNEWLTFEFSEDEDNWYCSNVKNISGLKYVHQLQNLYFSMTGEELTIR